MARKLNTEKKVTVSTPASAVPARRRAAPANRPARPAAPAEISDNPSSEPEAVPASPAARVFTATLPSREAVALLAHSFWEARGRQGGSPEQDWLRAEHELRAAYAVK